MGKAIRIVAKKAPEGYDLASSKFFGTPTVPLAWNGDFYDDEIFFCQIRLSDIAELDRENRLLFNGDICNGESLLMNIGPSCSTMQVYHEAMKKLWSREGEFDYILWGHDNLDKCDKTIIQDYIEASGKLISGEIKGEDGGDAMHSGCGCRYKRVLIWYDPERLV